VDIQNDVIPEVVARLPALRGPAGPVGPGGKLPIAKEWTRETDFYEGSVVTYDGGAYQALRDTGEAPDNDAHWRCLAAPGRDAKSIRHRGTFKEDSEYAAFEAVSDLQAQTDRGFASLQARIEALPLPLSEHKKDEPPKLN
jgi:hypothetical protein